VGEKILLFIQILVNLFILTINHPPLISQGMVTKSLLYFISTHFDVVKRYSQTNWVDKVVAGDDNELLHDGYETHLLILIHLHTYIEIGGVYLKSFHLNKSLIRLYEYRWGNISYSTERYNCANQNGRLYITK
jgi:hypothetical protein